MSYSPTDEKSFQINEKPSTVKSVFSNQQNLENHNFFDSPGKNVNLINKLTEIG